MENSNRAVDKKLESILARVQKPARYLGNEWNSIHKNHSRAAVRMVFAFPDLYEVGMSNQGLKILYESVNRYPDLLMERVFAPAVDMEELMRSNRQPLFALESRTPLSNFDVIGFSLQYELSYTNVLNMLDLAGISIQSSERGETDPLVIGGGPCTYNPEPLAPYFDLFVIGEAEEALPELLTALAEMKKKNLKRREILRNLSLLEGIYVPGFYRPIYRNGVFMGMEKLEPEAPDSIKKRIVADLDRAPYPTAPVVPYIQAVHDRAVIELFRGCGRGCRFCQAGFVFRPVRRRSEEKLIKTAEELIAKTGYDELSLSSLSSADYPGIDSLIRALVRSLSAKKVKCSLPSLRLDSYSVSLADQLHGGRRSSLTFAPEAATERLRQVIKKNISDEDIFNTLRLAVEAGWQGFKLYFMIGLPTEERADVEAIVNLCGRIRKHFRDRGLKHLDLSVSVATFVPKAHTPFQWEPQPAIDKVKERQKILQEGFKKMPGINFSWHDAEASRLEAVFARGDRTLAPLLERAWRLGCRFDGWSEHFSYSRWQNAFGELNLDPESYACRRHAYEDQLPWDHLNCGVSRGFFVRGHRQSLTETAFKGAANDQNTL